MYFVNMYEKNIEKSFKKVLTIIFLRDSISKQSRNDGNNETETNK